MRKPRLGPLLAAQLVASAGFSLALPFLSLYLVQQRGVPMALVGTVMLGAAFASALGQFLGGEAADRLGRRPTLAAALLLRVAAFLGLGALMALHGPVWAIVLLFLGVRVTGGMAMPPVSALVADRAERNRLEGYGLLRVSSNLGWGAGPALGGFLAASLPYAHLFLLAAGATGLALILVQVGVAEPPRRPPAAPAREVLAALRDRRLLAFLALCLPVFLVAGQMVSTLSVFAVERAGLSPAQFGGLLTLNGFLVAGAQYPLARVSGRWPRRRALALGAGLYGLGYLSFGWVRAYPLMLGAMAVVTLGEMLFAPAALAVAADLASPEHRGRYLGAFGLAESFGWSAGSFLGGLLLDLVPWAPGVWGAIAALGFLAAGLFLAAQGSHGPFQLQAARALDQKQGRP
ncbi:MAG: MFS transporter [Candidatus Bipolaricaulaceae bacterium]